MCLLTRFQADSVAQKHAIRSVHPPDLYGKVADNVDSVDSVDNYFANIYPIFIRYIQKTALTL